MIRLCDIEIELDPTAAEVKAYRDNPPVPHFTGGLQDARRLIVKDRMEFALSLMDASRMTPRESAFKQILEKLVESY